VLLAPKMEAAVAAAPAAHVNSRAVVERRFAPLARISN
jgi:hypothetical protein